MSIQHVCSAGCRVAAQTGTAPVGPPKHWTGIAGGGPTMEATIIRIANGRSFHYTAVGGRCCHIFTFATAPTSACFRTWVYISGTWTADACVAGFIAGTSEYGVRYKFATNQLVGIAGNIESTSPVTVVPGAWYCIEGKADVSTGTHQTDWAVNGASQTPVTRSAAASTLPDYRQGAGISVVVFNGEVYITGTIVDDNGANYPLGQGEGTCLRVRADGTHSFSAAGDFKYQNTTNVLAGATDTWTYIDDAIDNTTDFLAAVGAQNEYLEWQFDAMPSALSVNAIAVVSGHHSSNTNAHTQGLHLRSGASDVVVWDDADMSTGAALSIAAVVSLLAPGSVPWTKTLLDAITARWAASFTATPTTTSVPYIDALCIEVDYVPVVGQVLVPNATVAAGSWLDQGGSATDLASPLADDLPSTWIQSSANPVNDTVKLGLTDIGTPGAGDVIIEIDAEQI